MQVNIPYMDGMGLPCVLFLFPGKATGPVDVKNSCLRVCFLGTKLLRGKARRRDRSLWSSSSCWRKGATVFLGGGCPLSIIPALWGMENRIKGFPNLHFIVCEDFADSYFCGFIGWSVFWHIFVGFQVVWRQESCRLRMDGPVVNSESEASITWITGIFWTVKLDVTEAPITQIDKDGWWIWLLRIIGPSQINLFRIVAGKKGVVCLEYKGLVE